MKTQTLKLESGANGMKPRIILGRSEVSGFFSVYDGDVYADTSGVHWIVKPSGNHWTCYRLHGDHISFTEPHPVLCGIDGQMAMVQAINQIAAGF